MIAIHIRNGNFRFGKNHYGMPRDAALKASLNGYVVLDGHLGLVIRGARIQEGVEALVQNAQTARAHFMCLTPELLSSFADGEFEFFIEAYVQHRSHLDWPVFRRTVLPVLAKQLLEVQGVARPGVSNGADSLHPSISELLSEPPSSFSVLDESLSTVQNLFLEQLHPHRSDVAAFSAVHQPQRIVHGDLTPSNLLTHSGGMVLVDWTNGGWHNFAYDLLVTEIYFDSRHKWEVLRASQSRVRDNLPLFHGQLEYYTVWYERYTGRPLTESVLRAAIIISLAEFTVKNFRRHRSEAWQREGSAVLKLACNVARYLAG